MFAGTALAVGEWRGVLAVAIAAASFWRKLRLEEAVMRRQFGEAYGTLRRARAGADPVRALMIPRVAGLPNENIERTNLTARAKLRAMSAAPDLKVRDAF